MTRLLADEPEMISLEVLRRTPLADDTGGKTAQYELVAVLSAGFLRQTVPR